MWIKGIIWLEVQESLVILSTSVFKWGLRQLDQTVPLVDKSINSTFYHHYEKRNFLWTSGSKTKSYSETMIWVHNGTGLNNKNEMNWWSGVQPKIDWMQPTKGDFNYPMVAHGILLEIVNNFEGASWTIIVNHEWADRKTMELCILIDKILMYKASLFIVSWIPLTFLVNS
jgi:hypothetical protein